MSIFKKLEKVMDVITEPESVTKGNDFESYIVSLFPENKFALVEWSTDICRKHDRFVESDTRPDITVRHIKTGNVFHIECKFRSMLYENKLSWTNKKQLTRYQEFARESDDPVYVAVGLDGRASKPKYLFFIPLEEAKYPGLYPSVFERFERNRGKEFGVKRGLLV